MKVFLSLLSKNTYLKVKTQCIDKFVKLITCLETFLATGMNLSIFIYNKLWVNSNAFNPSNRRTV